MNFFMEIAKLRAARLLWAKLVKENFAPANPKSLSLRTHSQTSGWSLTAQDVYNNVIRTCIEAMAVDPGPHPVAAHQRARRGAGAADRLLGAHRPQHPAVPPAGVRDTTKVIDPWGGSYYVERLTADIATRALGHIAEVEELGGMAKAIEAGIPKLRIEEAAARTQARIDSGRQPVIGVNKFRLDINEQVDVLKIDNSAVRAGQIAKLERLRAERDQGACDAALEALTNARRPGEGNLLDLAVAGGAGQGHRRRDQRRAREGLRSAPRRDPLHLRGLPRRAG